ncbi:MAG: HDOD domain-containing protein [bacterium]|nr:HDOD domain-containing protein [bacterium]
MKDDFTETRIPPLSMVAIQIMQYDPDSMDASSYSMEQIVSPDKGVSAEILRISNSAFYGRSGKIKTLRDAITLLGLKTVKNLVILLSTKSLSMNIKGDLLNRFLQELPIVTALVAQDLSQKLGHKEMREEIFIGGLLHKIGMTILAINKGGKYSRLLDLAEFDKVDFIEHEREQFKTDHVEIGRTVFNTWKLPQQLQDIISGHNFDAARLNDTTDIVRLTALASLVAREMLGLQIYERDQARKAALMEYYKCTDTIEREFNEQRMGMIKDHPFYKQVVGG